MFNARPCLSSRISTCYLFNGYSLATCNPSKNANKLIKLRVLDFQDLILGRKRILFGFAPYDESS